MAWNLDSIGSRTSGTDVSFMVLRIAVSAILIWGALTKLAGGERIGEIAEIWAAAGLPQPQLLVLISIGLQLALGLLLLVGLFTRMAGLFNGVNFAVAAAMSGIFTSGSNWWPFALLIVLLMQFGILGAGTLSIDRMRSRRLALAAPPLERSFEEQLILMGMKRHSGEGNFPG